MTFEQIAKVSPAGSGRKRDQFWAEMGGDEKELFLLDILSIFIYFLNV